MRKRMLVGTLSLVLLVPMWVALDALATELPCTEPSPSSGGEWISYGQDPTNARRQDAEVTIDASNVHELELSWAQSAAEAGGGTNESGATGAFQSTAAVANGCVFAGTSVGDVFAFDATTGDVIWHVKYQTLGSYSTGVFAPAVVDGVVYANVATNSGLPYVVAINASDGTERWRTNLPYGLADGDVSLFGVLASAVVIDDMLFVPVTGGEGINTSHPSFYLLNRHTGAIIKKTIVIPQEEWVTVDPSTGGLPVHNWAGGTIWTTAAVDHANGYLYAGTGNPASKRDEHQYTNAILKIDVDPDRLTFGEIVASYKGDVDYRPEQYETTECQYLAEAVPYVYSPFCGQMDIDFGASPNLFTNSSGRALVGELQKSCTFHVVDAETMELVWKRTALGRPNAVGCNATSAYDDDTIYVNVQGDRMVALDKDTGSTRWVAQYGPGTGGQAQPVSIANGVAYTLTQRGELVAIEADSGVILLQLATPECSGTAGGGISIAYNTVFAECDRGSLMAFRVPA